MNKIFDTKSINASKSLISFETKGGDDWGKWDRYITIEGLKHFILEISVGPVNSSLKG